MQSYGNINASITATTGNILSVAAWGDISTPAGGGITAGQMIDAVRALGVITATVGAPDVVEVTPNVAVIAFGSL